MGRLSMAGPVMLQLLRTMCRLALGITDGLLPNGNFERGPLPSQLRGTRVLGSSSIPSWQTSGFVEYIPSGHAGGHAPGRPRGRLRRAARQRGLHPAAPPRRRPLLPHLQRGADVRAGRAAERVGLRPVWPPPHPDHVRHLPVDVRCHAFDDHFQTVRYAEGRLDRLSSSAEDKGCQLWGICMCPT